MAALASELEPVAHVESLVIAGPAGDLPVRLYTPEGTGPFPVLLFFQKSWCAGNLDTHETMCRGLCRRAGCLALTVDYAKQRKTFGDVLAERQGVQWILADCFTELHAAKLMVADAAAKLDAGEEARAETYMVKIYGDEMGFRVADRCLQLHGGIGLTTELPIEKFWRDQRSFMITEGPTEVLRTALAKLILRGAKV